MEQAIERAKANLSTVEQISLTPEDLATLQAISGENQDEQRIEQTLVALFPKGPCSDSFRRGIKAVLKNEKNISDLSAFKIALRIHFKKKDSDYSQAWLRLWQKIQARQQELNQG